ncbi:SphA family protein [Sandaracinus amylolyticus]|uniref:Transporter n=1 Tax=Sandaracinus amylolyticus TaxID=927083 RepID=A0A0F6VZH7_9BACT|nr:transporter [Sandaracinus amylolyticus]AKF03593.1 Hypothetical protein DB32_000742 [Sandaracinus amylolyticus]
MRGLSRALLVVATLLTSAPAAAQDLGHRLIGTQGLHAGRLREPGLYVADQLGYYHADTLRDREGAVVPIEDLRVDALANALGLSLVVELPDELTHVAITAAVPLARASLSADVPEASLDNAGLGDVYVQPLSLGWRLPHVDVVTGYALYLPTGLFRLGEGGISSGHITHELSLGTTIFADDERRYFASAMASYDLHQTKNAIDIRRGDTLTIQGGIGATLFELVDVGVVGAALWQTRDDEGADVPLVLQGARDRVLALGGEISVALPSIPGRIGARYVHELDVRSRTEGQVLAFQLALVAWRPEPRSSR